MKNKKNTILFTVIWLALWGAIAVKMDIFIGIKIEELSLVEMACLLAVVVLPLLFLFAYLNYVQEKKEKKRRLDEEYRRRVRSEHTAQRVRFEVIQPKMFANVNIDSFRLDLKNLGEDISELSFQVPLKSNVKNIYIASSTKGVKAGAIVSLLLHLKSKNKLPDEMHENLLPQNTIFSIKYNTASEDNLIETFQIAIDYHPQNSIIQIIKK